MSIVAYREGFVSLKVVWLYFMHKSKRRVKLCPFFTVNTVTPLRSFDILAPYKLAYYYYYLVSGTSVGNYVTNRVSCAKNYSCTSLSNSKSVQT